MKSRCLCEPIDANLESYSEPGYKVCHRCELIVRDEVLELEEEKSRYSMHENSIEDEAYIKFLTPAIEAAVDHLSIGKTHLDYGCGPEPVLSQIIQSKGYQSSFWDPFFFEDLDSDKGFDVITCTEVAEHFFYPATAFKDIFSKLEPGGHLIVQTHRYDDIEDFGSWYYQRDPTHVCFYNRRSFEVLASDFGCNLKVLSDKLVSLELSK